MLTLGTRSAAVPNRDSKVASDIDMKDKSSLIAGPELSLNE